MTTEKFAVENIQKGLFIDSKEVAEMVGRNHADVLRDIRKVIGHLSNESKIALVDYFLESTYQDSKGETRNCYQLTKKGCELFATRMTGSKGTQFAVTYIEKFNEMEEQLKPKIVAPSYMIDNPIERAKMWIVEQEEKIMLENEIAQKNEKIDLMLPKEEAYDTFIDGSNAQTLNEVAKTLNIGEQTLFNILKSKNILFYQGRSLVPYQRYIDNGNFIVKQKSVLRSGKNINYAQTLVTAKGVKSLSKVLHHIGYYEDKKVNQ